MILTPLKKLVRSLTSPLCSSKGYPARICEARKHVPKLKQNAVLRVQKPNSELPPGPEKIRLASDWHTVEAPKMWKETFEDPEDTRALHSWTWLTFALTSPDQKPTEEWICWLVRSWIDTMTLKPSGIAAEPFAISERIGNVYICSKAYNDEIPGDIAYALTTMGHELLDNLECSPISSNTVNNARALAFIAEINSSEEMWKVADAVLDEALEHLITNDGFLREGSSHYQFLVTRWLLEISYAAKKADYNPIISTLKKYLPSLLLRCRFFFLVEGSETKEIPLIGDVVPYFPPWWLLDVPYSKLAEEYVTSSFVPNVHRIAGWPKLWEKDTVQHSFTTSLKLKKRAVQIFNHSGWHRIELSDFILFLHTNPPHNHYPTHAHNDFLSFVLYYDRYPIFIDPGQSSRKGALGNYYISPQAHNTISIDNGFPFLGNGAEGPIARPQVKATESEKEMQVNIVHQGFRKLDKNITHTRTFKLSETTFSITDSYQGSGKRSIKTFFQFDKALKISNEDAEGLKFSLTNKDLTANFSIKSDYKKHNYDLKKGQETQNLAGICSPEYGQTNEYYTLALEQVIAFPSQQTFQLNVR